MDSDDESFSLSFGRISDSARKRRKLSGSRPKSPSARIEENPVEKTRHAPRKSEARNSEDDFELMPPVRYSRPKKLTIKPKIQRKLFGEPEARNSNKGS